LLGALQRGISSCRHTNRAARPASDHRLIVPSQLDTKSISESFALPRAVKAIGSRLTPAMTCFSCDGLSRGVVKYS